MTDFAIKQLRYDLTSHAGLALVGQLFKRLRLAQMVDADYPVRSGIVNSDIVKSYLGLLVQGKNDFDAIEAFRADAFFRQSLSISGVPSSPTLRQRLDAHSGAWFDLPMHLNLALLRDCDVDFGALPCGYMPVDWDTFVMDNSCTKKEAVGRTYQEIDGYCPGATYLGREGFCLDLSLRPGVQHSAAQTDLDLTRVLPMAAALTPLPLLFRADSGVCSTAIMRAITEQAVALKREIAFIIKWNPRRAPVEEFAAACADDPATQWVQLRAGKRETLWQERLDIEGVGNAQTNAARRIYRLTERTIDKHGQPLLLAQYVLEGWTTTLPARFEPQEIIALYADHATHEQFHSEFKSDMDLERLPSGKFDTNALICSLAAVAMNILRLLGQGALTGKDAPIRHSAKRRRIKTVMQELIFKAGRMIKHARGWALGLGANDRAYTVFERLHGKLRASCG